MASNLAILLSLFVLSVSDAKVFLSIDCGGTDVYTDDKTIEWSPDDAYIKTGESLEVSPLFSATETNLKTLRVFKASPTNCYSFNVEKGEQVLVRATFFYGNYDKKSSMPKFDLQLNGKDWAKVGESTANTPTYEAIVIANEGVISVCLVRTFGGQFPFIWALELRSLTANMYSRTNTYRTLYTVLRKIGSNNQTVRYPDDIYDRLWSPTIGGSTISSDTLQTIDITNTESNPPEAALKGAFTSLSTSLPLQFSLYYSLPIKAPQKARGPLSIR